jgi:hypothetical protein
VVVGVAAAVHEHLRRKVGDLAEPSVEKRPSGVPLGGVCERVPGPVLAAEPLEFGSIGVEAGAVAAPELGRGADLQGLLATVAVVQPVRVNRSATSSSSSTVASWSSSSGDAASVVAFACNASASASSSFARRAKATTSSASAVIVNPRLSDQAR